MTTRYDFYQTDTHLIVSIYKKGVPADQVRVVAKAEEVEVFVGEEVILRLGPLSGFIVAEEVTHKVFGTKIEVTLPKATGGHWQNLIRPEGKRVPQPTQAPIPQPKESTAAAPVSSTKKNWDHLAKEIEVEDQEPPRTPEDFFKSLYGDLDENSRRAMLKSYQESNGTVLSTNWGDVAGTYQAPQPPAGMEVKKD